MELEEAIKKEVTQKEIEKKKLEDNIKKQQQEKEAWKNEKRALEAEVDNLKADKSKLIILSSLTCLFSWQQQVVNVDL